MNPLETRPTERTELAKMVTRLFGHWRLSTDEQLALLGLSPANRGELTRYRKGRPLAARRDLLDRVGYLLYIHRSLRILFPHNRDLAYSWMTRRNRAFEYRTPAEMIQYHGFPGLLMVRSYLERFLAC